MPKAIMTVRSCAASASQERAFNEWYDEVHIPEVCQIDGFVEARRYKLHGAGDSDLPTYLTVYELDADDPAASVAELRRRAAAGETVATDTVASDPRPELALYIKV